MTGSIVLWALLFLLACTPVLAFSGTLSQDITNFFAAAILFLSAAAPRKVLSDALDVLRPIWIVILFPVAWMILQLAPMHADALANPIWLLASRALNERIFGHISVDPGNTLRSLIFYVSIVSTFVVTAAVARNRRSADRLLLVAGAVTAATSAVVLIFQFAKVAGMTPVPDAGARYALAGFSASGVALCAGAFVWIIERRFIRPAQERSSPASLLMGLLMFVLGSAINLAALLTVASRNVMISALLGLAVVILVVIIRQLALRSWLLMAVLIAFFMTASGLVMALADYGATSALLTFATGAAEPSITVGQRALSDSNYWLGTGVGTYDALVSIHRDISTPRDLTPPSSVLAIAIEWGKIPLIVLTLSGLYLFAILFRGALERGRDACFPASAAACLAIAICQAFCDPSLTYGAAQLFIAIVLGMGTAQTTGQTNTR